MNVLEKFLEEIEERVNMVENIPVDEDDDFLDGEECYEAGRVQGRYEELLWCRNMIRFHMDDCKTFEFDFNRVKSFDCQCGRHYVNTYNDGWIPVEERLPNQNGVYNVTRLVDDAFISDSAYFDGQDTWHNDNRVNHIRPYLTDIVAWQPLPEPYKAMEG